MLFITVRDQIFIPQNTGTRHGDYQRNLNKNRGFPQGNIIDHVQMINQERFPSRILEWCPPGRQRKGRPRRLQQE